MTGRFDLDAHRTVRLGACRLCPAWCPVEATIEHGVVTEVRGDAQAMVADRHLLPEDVDAMVERAGALWDFVCPR